MKVSFSHSIENVEWSRMKDIYHSIGWKNHDEEKIKKIFQSSSVVAIAYDENKITGFGRALSDG
ncbi:MAG: GNAT family N-acetyltransferase, partial [Priestia megaterium]